MTLDKMLKSWGEPPGEKREAKILKSVLSDALLPIEWCAVTSVIPGHSCTFYAASDALKVGDASDFVRVNVSHTTAQKVVDALGLAIPTTKIADLIHTAASVVILPQTQDPDAAMANTSRMVLHSKAVSAHVDERSGLVSTVGKDWVLTNKLVGRPDRAANYGWHVPSSSFRGPGGAAVYQPLGLAHNRFHTDYSQVLRPIHRWLVVDGKNMLLEDVLTNPELATLLSDEGALKIVRHPGVPAEAPCLPADPVCGGPP